MPSDTDATQDSPLVFVLFGATGDLAKRMVLPAFHELHLRGLLPRDWRLIGNGRGHLEHEDFHARVRESLEEFGDGEPEDFDEFATHLRFAGGGFSDEDPGSLLDVLAEARDDLGDPTLVHYLAVPPTAFTSLTRGLAEHDLVEGSRVVYEKPYGDSLASFRELDELVHSVMAEDQVFRIDHFLGKEATQNLHVLRFGNEMVGRIWHRDSVAQVQVDVPETLDVADRAEFYDSTGAFRDMVVTHLLQVAAEVAMEPPLSMAAEDLQDAREGVIAAFRPLDPQEAVTGQYDGYTDLPDVPDDSTTDTFAAVRLWVDTDRWHGVPFVLRSGKQLAESKQVVSLLLRQPDGPLGNLPGRGTLLQFSLSGDGAVEADLVVKKPGPDLDLVESRTAIDLAKLPGGEGLSPYAALLHDVTTGDRSLFTSSAGLEAAWTVGQPVLDHMPTPTRYAPGGPGPRAAEDLTDGVGWLSDAAVDPHDD